MRLQKLTYSLISSIAFVLILSYGRSLLIPLILALFIWFLVHKIKSALDRVKLIRERFPSWLKSLITSIFIFSILILVSNALSNNIIYLANSYQNYTANLDLIALEINRIFNIDLGQVLSHQLENFDYGNLLSSIFNSISDLLGNVFMVLIYILFIFLEETHFARKLKAVFKDEKQLKDIQHILAKINQSIADYIGTKTLVSFITAFASYIVLLVIGIDSPLFWSSLIFTFNYIPNIGSLIATLFPAIFALLQFGTLLPGLEILLGVGLIQVLVGNVLEPRLIGNSLNMSPLATIIALAFWGVLWGVTGMILSIPITVVLLIICAQFDQTRFIAVLLSSKGVIDGKMQSK